LGVDVLISKPSKGSSGKTGLWRTFKPVYYEERCVGCGECYLYCPEDCIVMKDLKVEIDYEFCKGCGICSNVCPANAIEMVKEV
jgi:pyruvate ferredoxin oxidoreductase delta subunit